MHFFQVLVSPPPMAIMRARTGNWAFQHRCPGMHACMRFIFRHSSKFIVEIHGNWRVLPKATHHFNLYPKAKFTLISDFRLINAQFNSKRNNILVSVSLRQSHSQCKDNLIIGYTQVFQGLSVISIFIIHAGLVFKIPNPKRYLFEILELNG